jgi:hypothetical protein
MATPRCDPAAHFPAPEWVFFRAGSLGRTHYLAGTLSSTFPYLAYLESVSSFHKAPPSSESVHSLAGHYACIQHLSRQAIRVPTPFGRIHLGGAAAFFGRSLLI